MDDTLIIRALLTIIEKSFEHNRKIEGLERDVAALKKSLNPLEKKDFDAEWKRLQDIAFQWRPEKGDLGEQLLEARLLIRDYAKIISSPVAFDV